jgi:hypothetical protein
MLFLLSSAKTLDWKSPIPEGLNYTEPKFLETANELVRYLQNFTRADLQNYLQVSEKLAELNYQRFQNWNFEEFTQELRPALLAYHGDVFRELEIDKYDTQTLQYGLRYTRIVSGLYGLLRGGDLIQPYRLEMRLDCPHKSEKLSDFWGSK